MSGVESMPLELRERPQWVLWREEQRDGKLTKIPYRPADPSKRASATDPGTWAPFEEARSALRLEDGLGYVFATNDPYCGVDIDGCRDPETGLLDPEAGAVVQGLNSYTEASVSGTGVHAIVQAELPGTRRRTGKYEMYSDGRYFAMTGEHLAGTPTTIEERQVELETLYFTLFPRSENGDKPTLLASPAALDDVELIERAMAAKDGEKFRRLWSGDWSGYDSQSEADLALCALLAFWTGVAPNRMDSLFRSSGLMRDKWDDRRGESTYGVQTIEKALEEKTEVYSAPAAKKNTPDDFVGSVGAARAEATAEGQESSNKPPDADEPHSWTPIDLLARALEPPEPPTIGGVCYPGRRHVYSGEPESLKSMAALALCYEEMKSGRTAMYVNIETDIAETLERLRQVGADDEMIAERFVYVEPDEPLSADIMADVVTLLETRRPSILVVDSMIGILVLHDFNPDSGSDVERFYLTIDAALGKYGAARIYLDHVVKNKDVRGKFAIGSERKIGRADVHLSFEVVHPFARGRSGLVKLVVAKDRPGHLPRPKAAEIEFRSDPETGAITYSIRVAEKRQGEEEKSERFRPTVLMERVCETLEERGEPMSRSAIVENTRGATEYLRLAIDVLLEEGFTVEEDGPRGARNVRLIRRFVAVEETTPPNPASPRLSPRLGGVTDDPASPPFPLQGGRGRVGGVGEGENADPAYLPSPTSTDLSEGWLGRSLEAEPEQ